jgi:hypothetical protein
LKEDNRVGCQRLPHVWSLELGQRLVQVQREFPGRLAEEESEEFLAKLKLLVGGKLVQSLVNLKLPAEVKMDLFLVKLGLLLEEGETGSLVKLKFLLEKEMVEPLVNLDLKHAEARKSPQVDSTMFLLQIPNKGVNANVNDDL